MRVREAKGERDMGVRETERWSEKAARDREDRE